MKKNLRIVSAAAAALLAVAPVAASAVSTVNAETTSTNTDQTAKTDVTVPGVITLERGSNTQFSLSLNATQQASLLQQLRKNDSSIPANAEITNVTVTQVSAQDAKGEFTQTFTFDVVSGKDTIKSGVTGTATAKFASQQGTPYFYGTTEKSGYYNTVINNGSTVKLNDLANGFSASSLLKEIRDNFAWKTSDASGSTAEMTTTASDVESQLVAQGLKRASNGDFDYPANGFNLKLTAKSENGNTASITVRINADVNYNAPVFVVDENGTKKLFFNEEKENNLISGTKDNPIIKDNKLNTKYIESIVTAYVQSAYGNGYDDTAAEVEAHQQKINSSNVKFDYSKVNTSVAGIYPVVVSATNPAGFTSKMTLYVVVNGPVEKAPQQYVVNDGTKVYNINGNVVSEATNVTPLAKGTAVYTFGKVTVNGVEYTRINSNDSNEFVKSSDLTATKPADETVASVSKRIMHNAYYYNKKGKRVGTDSVKRYNSVNVLPNTTSFGGKTYYQVVENGKAVDKYINAANIDGTKRTLTHNAYVYSSSKKRANKVVLKKGETVTTYGASYKFKNGQRYYKIGDNTDKTYVKVANFR